MPIKVSELPVVDLPLTCDELIMVVQGGSSKKATVRDLPFSPTYSVGLIANRYYSAPAISMTATAVAANNG